MNELIPTKRNSEDIADISIREYMESKGWKTAFYSPPHGSWSIIKLNIKEDIYETFVEGKGKRPDLIIYKLNENELSIIAFESKEDISKFNIEIIESYYKEIHTFIENMIKQKYRLAKINNVLIENQNLPAELKINYKIIFLVGTTSIDEDYPKFKEILTTKSGILITTDWDNLIITFKTINIIPDNYFSEIFTYHY